MIQTIERFPSFLGVANAARVSIRVLPSRVFQILPESGARGGESDTLYSMAPTQPQATAQRLTGIQWVICVIAAIGFAFDTYALLVAPLIMGPALGELGHLKPRTPEFNYWVGLLFYIPAVAGGIFGLLGGYLTDRLGRRRILVWSILL